ncbi:MAG: hypothetical protein A2Y17_10840 [Clostridiales bacterium GWF2_38_85]|nr:MAG: hypothetical protein A2Y17_10840 [Clostridiales bacterium GWF2_38_85]HBL84623.1 hypothetical protein [Clostridiales bacterium]
MSFSVLARFYDRMSDTSVYDDYLSFITAAIEKYSLIKVEDILDLACGTGQLAYRLQSKGYGMVCVDESSEMLSKARENGEELLLLNQSMYNFELYGTVQATVCTLDSLNYLKAAVELEKVFSLVRNYTEKGGLFIFDVNTKYRFDTAYGDKSFVLEQGGDMLIWQNSNRKNGTHILDITLFEEQPDGSYQRYDEQQRQKYFSLSTIDKLLKNQNFEFVAVFGDLKMGKITPDSEKYYIIARCI